jgi:hypothetical protein
VVPFGLFGANWIGLNLGSAASQGRARPGPRRILVLLAASSSKRMDSAVGLDRILAASTQRLGSDLLRPVTFTARNYDRGRRHSPDSDERTRELSSAWSSATFPRPSRSRVSLASSLQQSVQCTRLFTMPASFGRLPNGSLRRVASKSRGPPMRSVPRGSQQPCCQRWQPLPCHGC